MDYLLLVHHTRKMKDPESSPFRAAFPFRALPDSLGEISGRSGGFDILKALFPV
ncbi:MAG: hypothetical protein LKE85_16410 [Lachnospiraceae bacterium]|jgi:hypothetical protein|nr:hypothetical protein [Lachnospiraceae bacterium]